MIDIDLQNGTYTCPYCGCKQSLKNISSECYSGHEFNFLNSYKKTDLIIKHIKCSNEQCSQITAVAFDLVTGKQFDLYPEKVHKEFPPYVPTPIREDYVEAILIMDYSPKAAATLLRRCLQGMIRDFWGIQKKTLKDEIDALKEKVSTTQWNAIDGLRKMGNIGAHMEKNIDLIIEIDEGEAMKLARLIELLVDKWYVTRHDEEELYKSVIDIANSKKDSNK